MEARTDLAIVLRSVPFEDRHRVITALTENHGQISALAKNSIQSRRFGGTLEPFAASDWDFAQKPGAELYQLNGASIRQSFDGLRTSFEKLSLASVFSEIMIKIAPQNENCKGLFQLHSNALSVVSNLGEVDDINPNLTATLLNAYMAKALQWSGHQPRLQNCLQCHKPLEEVHLQAEVSCHIASAGWICPNCSPRTRIDSFLKLTPLALRDFHLSLCTPIRQIPQKSIASLKDHQELFKFIEALYIYHIPGFDRHPLKSIRFLGHEFR